MGSISVTNGLDDEQNAKAPMREVIHLTRDDARRVPWKNGRGVTEELAVWPDNASFERSTFDWRISKAAVDENGSFSFFPNFERILVVTSGDGLVLEHGDEAPRVRLRRFEPYRFSGDWPTTAELVSGPVGDFNVLLRRGVSNADVQVLRLGRRRAREPLASGHAFLHTLTGAATARITNEEDPFELAPGDSVWGRDVRDGEEIDLIGMSEDCVLLLVRIDA